VIQPSGPQLDIRTDIGRPDFGMRGVNSGAAAKICSNAATNAICAPRSR